MSCSCRAISSMRLMEEKEEKKQRQVGKKTENQFRKLSWRALPGEGRWVFILHTLAGLKHFIWDKQNASTHTDDIIHLSVWLFNFTDLWNKLVASIWPDGGSKTGMYLVDANPRFQLWVHVCLYLEAPQEGKFMLSQETMGWGSWSPSCKPGQESQGSSAGAGGSRSWHRSAQAPHVLVRN